jgi:hypothetical protein
MVDQDRRSVLALSQAVPDAAPIAGGGTTADHMAEGTTHMKLMHRAITAATVITSIGLVGWAGTASAGPCEPRSTAAAFAAWGDDNQYFLANGGDFERGGTPWSTWGAARSVLGQNPFGIAGPGSRSLRLHGGSGAQSPAICVFDNEESLRFAYRAPFGGATMEVYVEVATDQGVAATTTHVTAANRRWDVTPIIELPNMRDTNGQQWITITLTPLDGRGTWQVDDVMIDPWVAR